MVLKEIIKVHQGVIKVSSRCHQGPFKGLNRSPQRTHLAMEALRRIPSNRRPSAVTVNPPRTGPPDGEIAERAGSR